MAKTNVSSTDELKKIVFEKKLFEDMIINTFWKKFWGGSRSAVHVKTDFKKGKGSEMRFGLRAKLTGAGVEDGQVLEGQEESINTYDYNVKLKRYRHAVRDDGALTRQRPVWDLREESRSAIQDWGTEKIDQLHFDAAFSSPSVIFYVDGTSSEVKKTAALATAKAALTAANSKVTPHFLTVMNTWAGTGGNESQPVIRPIIINGKPYRVVVIHDDGFNDLWNNSEIQQANREARSRGITNPLYLNADIIWNDMIIYKHRRCPIFLDGGGAAVAGGRGLIFGAQALLLAWGEAPNTVRATFDYEEEIGDAWRSTLVVGKPEFDDKDYGVLNFAYARSQISDMA